MGIRISFLIISFICGLQSGWCTTKPNILSIPYSFENTFLGKNHVEISEITAPPSLILSKTSNKVTAAPGELFTYTIRYRAASLIDHASNAKIVDVLPSAMEIVSYTLAGSQVTNVVVSGNTITWDLASQGNTGQLDAGSTGMITVTARFPACAASGSTASAYSSTATFSATGATSVTSTASVTLTSNVPTCTAAPATTTDFRKVQANSIISENGGYMTYTFTFPASTIAYTVTDNIPTGFLPRFINRRLDDNTDVKFEIKCANSATWFTVFNAGSGSNGFDKTSEIPAAALECIGVPNPINSDEELFNITAVRWTIPASTVAKTMMLAIRGHAPKINPFAGINVNYSVGGSGAALPGFSPLVAGQTLNNCAQSSITTMGNGGVACAQSTVGLPGLTPDLKKQIVGSPFLTYPTVPDPFWELVPLNPNANPPIIQTPNDIIYGFDFKQSEYFTTSWEHPVVTDLLDANVDFIPYPAGNNWWAIAIENETSFLGAQNAYNDLDCHNPVFTVIKNFNGTGRTLLRWDFSGCEVFGSGHDTQFFLYYSVKIKAGTPNGTVIKDMNIVPIGENENVCECANGSKAGSEQTDYWAATTDLVDFDGDGNTAELLCKSNVVSYTVNTETDFISSKWVKGKLDGSYSRYPFTGTTDLTGAGAYQMFLENTGNVNITQLEVVDILPFVGDNGVLPSTGARNSQWSEKLASAVLVERWNAGSQTWVAVPLADIPLGLRYSTSTNPCRFANASTNNADLSTVSAVGPTGCTTSPWTSSTTNARSFAFRFLPSTVFAPNEKLRITVPVVVNGNPPGCNDPACVGDVLTNNATAWNSFAYGSFYSNGGSSTRLLDSEPIKVGLKMADLSTHTSLGNFVWNDANANGKQDLTEDPLISVTVSLWNNAGTTKLAQVLTDSLGFYRFYGLDLYTSYKIRLDNPADYTGGTLANFTLTTANASGVSDLLDSDASLNASGFPEITASLGPITGVDIVSDPTEYPSFDFGFFQANSIGDYVWYDVNANGAQDFGEKPVANATVRLYSVGVDGKIGGGDDVLKQTQVTTANGFYTFENIPNGVYYVHFDKSTITGIAPTTGVTVVPANWIFTATYTTGNDFTDSDANVSTGFSGLIILSGNTFNTSVDAGIKPSVTNPAAITGVVWQDLNANGLRVVTEPFVQGVKVVLLNSAGLPVATTYTDGVGRYLFGSLTPGQSYQVWFVPSLTSTITLKDQGANDQIDSDATIADGLTVAVTPTNNQTIDYIDMGLITPPSIGDRVWLDTNGNGLQDSGEYGLGNVTLTLHDMTASGAQVGTATTNEGGIYTFGGYKNSNMSPILSNGSASVSSQINSGSDDAEEAITTATVSTGSSDLEMCYDGSTKQLIGLRFPSLSIPKGATITAANIQFSTDNSSPISAGTPQIVIKGVNGSNEGTFYSGDKISTRVTTTDSVVWSPAAWNTVGERAANQLTPNLSAIVQTIVNRADWNSGGYMAFVISSPSASGHRSGEVFNDIPASAPTLTVTYTTQNYTARPLQSNRSYEVRMDLSQPALDGTVLTKQNAGSVTSNDPVLDNNDSDASKSGTIAKIALNTPLASNNNNSYDFGMYFPVPEICANNFDDDADGLTDCADPDCKNITLSNVTVSSCINHPLMDVATLSVNVAWTNAPSNDRIVVQIFGHKEWINSSSLSSPQTITFNIPADGTSNNQLIAKWETNTTLCADTILYNAPAACSSDTIGCSILYLCGEDKPYDGDAWDHGFMEYINAVNGSNVLDGILTKPDASGYGTYDINSPTTFVNVNFSNYDLIIISATTEAHIATDLVNYLKNFSGAVYNSNYLINDELGMSSSSGGYQFQTHLYTNNTTQQEIYNYNNDNPTYGYVFTRGNPLSGADSYLWTNAGEQALGVNSVYFVYDINDNLTGVASTHGRRVYLGYHMNGIYANAQNGGVLPSPVGNWFNPTKHLTPLGKTYFDQALIAATLACNDEICDDNIDNDGNGLTDCADPACKTMIATIGSNSAFCAGATLQLTVTGSGGTAPYTWAWSGPVSFTSTAQNPTRASATAAMSGTYTVTISDAKGCTATSNTAVTIQAAASVTVSGAVTICTGGTGTLTATPTGGAGTCSMQWQWSPDGTNAWTNLAGATSNSYTSAALTTTTYYRARYTCTGTNCAVATSNVVAITVVADPIVNINGGNVTICTGGTVSLTAVVTGGTGTISYQWQDSPNGTTFTNISGATSSNYTTAALTANRYYKVIANFTGNGCESNTSTVALITIVPDPSVSVTGQNQICTGGSVVLTATTAGGTGTCTLQWQVLNGVWLDISGATSSTYSTPNLTANTSYRARYICTGGGCDPATSATHVITIAPDPTVTISVPNNQICVGGGVVLTATPSGGLGTCVLQWQNSTNNTTWINISGATSTSYTTPNLAASLYYRAVYTCDRAGCCD